jgi:hypothetical protein
LEFRSDIIFIMARAVVFGALSSASNLKSANGGAPTFSSPTWQWVHRTPRLVEKPFIASMRCAFEMSFGKFFRFLNVSGTCALAALAPRSTAVAIASASAAARRLRPFVAIALPPLEIVLQSTNAGRAAGHRDASASSGNRQEL